MILLRKTTLNPSTKIKLSVPGVIDTVLPRTEEGVVVEGVEILTKNIKDVNRLVPLHAVDLLWNMEDQDLYTRTDIGLLAYDDRYLLQLNSKNEVVLKVPLDIYTALKLMSMRKNNEEPKTLSGTNPIVEVSHAGLVQMGMSPRFIKPVFKHEGSTYTNVFGNLVRYSKTYTKDRREIPAIYSIAETPAMYVVQLNTYNAFTVFNEKKFVIWNDLLYMFDDYAIRLTAPYSV